MELAFDAKQCINCLACMTIDECRLYIDAIRHGGPRLKEKNCDECSKCIDICNKALYERG